MSRSGSIFDSWDPFQALRILSDSHPIFASESSASANTRLDWKETHNAHVFTCDLPGLSKNDVKLELVDGRVLEISGERKEEEEDGGKDVKWHCAERSGTGKFLRRLRLPEDAVAEKVTARMEDGVLTVTVPKEEGKGKEKVKVRSVEIGGGEGKKSGKSKKGVFCWGLGVGNVK